MSDPPESLEPFQQNKSAFSNCSRFPALRKSVMLVSGPQIRAGSHLHSNGASGFYICPLRFCALCRWRPICFRGSPLATVSRGRFLSERFNVCELYRLTSTSSPEDVALNKFSFNLPIRGQLLVCQHVLVTLCQRLFASHRYFDGIGDMRLHDRLGLHTTRWFMVYPSLPCGARAAVPRVHRGNSPGSLLLCLYAGCITCSCLRCIIIPSFCR